MINGISKKIIHRLNQYGFLSFVSDESYLRWEYKNRTGLELNLDNPLSFNEKMQYLKLHDRREIYHSLVDKYLVRKYIAEAIGEEYLIPLIGVYDSFDQIDFGKLPNQFVIKCTHDSGGNVVCTDKTKLNINKAKEKIRKSLRSNFYWSEREWPYKGLKPRIIIEEYLEDEQAVFYNRRGLTDYKFFCFDGTPQFLYVSQGLEDHKTASISFFDFSGNKLPFHRADYKEFPGNRFELPGNFEHMLKIAEKLAKKVDNPFIRVDLYSVNGRILFSELTFFPCSGMVPFEPKEYNDKLGSMITFEKLKD